MEFDFFAGNGACQLKGSRSLPSTHQSGHLREKRAILLPANDFDSRQKAQWPPEKNFRKALGAYSYQTVKEIFKAAVMKTI